MRYLIANWKMQLGPAASAALAAQIVAECSAIGPQVRLVLCPSLAAIEDVAAVLKGSSVALGAQDCFWKERGAYTGEVGPGDLVELGCSYVIVGHSERRQHLGETDAMVHAKAVAALAAGLTPIVCVGETVAERASGQRDAVIAAQTRAVFEGIVLLASQNCIVAYEPRWAIGSGQAVAPEDAATAQAVIRGALPKSATQCAVIYGGSADEKNLAGFLKAKGIDGVLVGGASLDANEFLAMAEICLHS